AADAEHRASLAVRPAAGEAPRARAARRVDLAHHPPSHPRLGPCGRFDASHELVTRDARERVVAPHELEIRVADSRDQDAHARLARGRLGPREVVTEPDRLRLEPEPAHGTQRPPAINAASSTAEAVPSMVGSLVE